MSNLKRDNWTTEEIISILQGFVETEKGEFFEGWNQAIDHILDEFRCCALPQEVFGALAYNPVEKEFVHIGEIPQDCKMIGTRSRK